MRRLRIDTRINRDDYDQDDYVDAPRRAYPIERAAARRGSGQAPGVTPTRFYRETTHKEIETNATDINLGEVVGFGRKLLASAIGVGGGGLVLFLTAGMVADVMFKLVFAATAVVVGYKIFKKPAEKGGGDGSRD